MRLSCVYETDVVTCEVLLPAMACVSSISACSRLQHSPVGRIALLPRETCALTAREAESANRDGGPLRFVGD